MHVTYEVNCICVARVLARVWFTPRKIPSSQDDLVPACNKSNKSLSTDTENMPNIAEILLRCTL
jgi:hypothetical protein